MDNENKTARRKWFIKHPLQNMYVSELFFAITIPMILIAVIVYIIVWNHAFVFIDKTVILNIHQKTELFKSTNTALLSLMPLIIICLLGWIVFISTSMSGPLFRLISDINKIIKGEKDTGIRLREDDMPELKILVKQINHILDTKQSHKEAKQKPKASGLISLKKIFLSWFKRG